MAGHTPRSEIRAKTDSDPARRARVETIKREMRTAEVVVQLAVLRKRRKITQKDIAAQLGISQARVSKIENGDDLQLTTLERYIEALGRRLKVEAVFSDATLDLSGTRSAQDAPASVETKLPPVTVVLGDKGVMHVPVQTSHSRGDRNFAPPTRKLTAANGHEKTVLRSPDLGAPTTNVVRTHVGVK